MTKKAKTPAAKKASTPIELGSFGGVTALMFHNGGSARVHLNSVEIKRLTEALFRYVLRRQRVPQPELLAALERLHRFFSGAGYDIRIVLDVPIAAYGVELNPIEADIDEVLARPTGRPSTH